MGDLFIAMAASDLVAYMNTNSWFAVGVVPLSWFYMDEDEH